MNRLKATHTFISTHQLGSRHKLRAWRNWVSWQVRSRVHAGPHVVPFVDGTRLLISRGMHGATGNIYCGLHEFEEMCFAMHLLRPQDLFVDVGANVGTYTILASGVCGARTLAVEPGRPAIEAITANIRLNELSELVELAPCAVGAARGTVRMTTGFDCTNRVSLSISERDSEEVEQFTLDELIQAEPPTLLKIDVEGYEGSVLEGASATLARKELESIIVEVNRNNNPYGAL